MIEIAFVFVVGVLSGGVIALIALSYFMGTVISNMMDEMMELADDTTE